MKKILKKILAALIATLLLYGSDGLNADREDAMNNLLLTKEEFLFTFHNFREGYLWVFYTYKVYDVDGNILTGSSRIPSKWKIVKTNGSWEIVEIYEDP